jgi:alkanesulfonate monooxygenase SsuD/methylene tetrahydromethanopterin reductase-like flavin-dependent oxidoreductase (luciferase family)
VSVLPRPVQQPVPIWLVANPDPAKKRNVETALRRVVRLADGWQTTWNTPESFSQHLSTIERYAHEDEAPVMERYVSIHEYGRTVLSCTPCR